MSDYKPLDEPWLERYHINKYVKPYDARVEGRYLNPPKFDKLSVGDRVFVSPRGRYKWVVSERLYGSYGFVEHVYKDTHPLYGRKVKVKLILSGEDIYFRESAFRLPKRVDKSKSHDK